MNQEIKYVCNICGQENHQVFVESVPGNLCENCRSSVRFRQLMDVLTRELCQSRTPLFQISANCELRGIGLSDPPVYSRVLEQKFSRYINTFLHKQPKLDITKPDDEYQNLDFIISGDVFEHTAPPVTDCFQQSCEMLKKDGGTLIFSVPCAGRYHEHYPSLKSYQAVEFEGEHIVVYKNQDGSYHLDTTPRFHGGPGSTLEMRVFSESKIEQILVKVGFSSFKKIDYFSQAYGIWPIQGLSTVWTASRAC